MIWFYFLISALSVWRLTHLLVKEDGPFDIIFSIRKKVSISFFVKLLDCFYCLSIWVALPLGIWLGTNWIEKVLIWFGLSGAACLLEQASTKIDLTNNTEYHED